MVTTETDASGRLLLEDSAPKQAQKKVQRAGIEMKSVTAEYHDTPSRVGALMNVSAYEALRQDTAAILNGFAWLTERYLEAEPGKRRGTVDVLVNVSSLAVTLPVILFHRAEGPFDRHGQLPTFVANLFKAGRGLFSVAVDMANDDRYRSATVTALEVVEFADRKSHFKRANTSRVCAAPTRLIERTIDAILTGTGADAGRSGLGELVDFSTLWAYHSVERKFSRSCRDYGYMLEGLSRGSTTRPEQLFGAVVEVEGRPWTFGRLTEAFVEYANVVQAELNRILGRAQDATPVTLNEALRLL